MRLFYTACGGEHILAHGFEDEDCAGLPPRPGQWESPTGEWWGVSLTEEPEPMGMMHERFLSVDILDDVVLPYVRYWDDTGQAHDAALGPDEETGRDYLVPAAVLREYAVVRMLSD